MSDSPERIETRSNSPPESFACRLLGRCAMDLTNPKTVALEQENPSTPDVIRHMTDTVPLRPLKDSTDWRSRRVVERRRRIGSAATRSRDAALAELYGGRRPDDFS